jgi:hypothetical protein
MRQPSSFALSLTVVIQACCFTPQAPPEPAPVTTTPPPPQTAVAPVVGGAIGSGAAGCPELRTAIVGSFAREGVVEEYREDGSYTLNGMPGTLTWMRAGHAMIDVPAASFHMEYDLALADAMTLVSSDPNRIGAVATRTSPPPAIPPTCFDLATVWVGTWTPSGGGANEQYNADGSYAAPGVGQWSMPAPGRLHLVNVTGATSDYILGMASPGTALAVSLPPLAPAGIAYTRAP